jgi:alpha-2-macroglobulin
MIHTQRLATNAGAALNQRISTYKKTQQHWMDTAWAVALMLLLSNCQNSIRNDAFYEGLSQYVYAYTSGSIDRSDAIRFRFVNPAIRTDQVGQAVPAELFSLSPKVAGKAVWEDERTIVFRPAEKLPSGQAYEGEVNLGRIWGEVPRAYKTYEFDFRVRDLTMEVHSDGLQAADPTNLKQQQWTGRIITNDEAESAKVEQLLRAQQGSKNLNITWSHTDGGRTHAFVVNGIERSNERSRVDLTWDGSPLGITAKGDKALPIPSLDDFEVVSVRAEQTENQCVVVNFSDPVSPQQTLDGLVQINGYSGQMRYLVDGNSVRVYPNERVSGQRQLTVAAAVRNSVGASMKKAADWPLGFENLKPQVRLVGRGAIIPGKKDGSVIFPFEAVGLNAVDVEIFKIYNSNILQFLQVNEIEGSEELQRVGKITMQKKIALTDLDPNASAKAWQRYALDLKPLIQQDPSAIYQVRILFRKSYALSLDCSEAGQVAYNNQEDNSDEGDEGDGEYSEEEEGDGGPSESTQTVTRGDQEPAIPKKDQYGNFVPLVNSYRGLYWDNNDYDWNDDYEYSNRRNPCKREYYVEDVFDERNVYVSDLGLTAKRGLDGSVFAAVTDLNTAQPMSGIALEFFNFQLQPIGKATTGRDGIAIATKLSDVPFIMVATQGSHRGYLRMAEGSTLSLSRFDVSGVQSQRGMKGYMYGERGVWRPGDSIYLDFVLEDVTGQLPATHPINFEVTDPKGTVRYRHVVNRAANATPGGGVYPLHFATSPEAPTGNWMARAEVGGATFTKQIKVETVKPNRLKLDLDFGKKQLTASDNGTNSGRLNVKWLHGAVAQNLKTKVEMQVRSAVTTYPNFKDYVFEDPARSFWSEPQVLFDGTLDNSGNAIVPFKIEMQGDAPGKLIASFKVRAFEQGGDFSTDNFSMDYFPYQRMVGVKIPNNVAINASNDVLVACVDNNGKPLANKTIEVGMYRCDWRWWWDEDRTENVAQFNSATHVNAIDKATLTTNAQGVAVFKAKPDRWGRYLIRATDSENGDAGHAAGSFFWVGYPDRNDNLQSRNSAAMLPLTADKEKYNVGEKINIKVPGSTGGKALVTIENGQKVVQHLWFDTKPGDNMLTFDANENMTPAVYAHVTLLQPHAQTANDLPIRMYGVVPIYVENPVTHLNPIVEMAEALRPDENFTVRIKEAKGMACMYTLAIVDEGLLDLTRFKTPNPWEVFFAREALGVQTWDLYDYVLGAYGVELERILSVGGDGLNQKAKNAAQVNRFKPVVKHIGPFFLEKGKTAAHQFKIENYVGSVRVMAVMSSPAPSNKGAYGSAEKTVPVRKPVMVMPTLPRVLGPGETLRLPVDVFAMENQVKEVTVRARETSGLVTIGGTPTQTLNFSEPGQKMAYFELKVGNKPGPAKFIIEANGAGESAKSEIEILVRNPMPMMTSVLADKVEPGAEWVPNFNAQQYASTEALTLEVTALPPMSFTQHLDYLIHYPHGCLEQTTSGAFPQLYVDGLVPLSAKKRAEVTKNISVAINKIINQQESSGAFAYWPGGYVSDWASTYAGHFLLEAKSKGYAVPDQVLEKWTTFQTNVARSWRKQADDPNRYWYGHDDELTQAYRLYTLALAGKAPIADMNRLREEKNLYSETGHVLASAYAASGKPEVARELISKGWRDSYKYTWCGNSYGSDLRDRALLLETYTATGDQARASAMIKYMSDELNRNTSSWYWNTQTIATCLRAFSKYAASVNNSNVAYTVAVNGRAAQKGDVSKPISVTVMDGDADKIAIKNTGSVRLYAHLVHRGQALPNTELGAEYKQVGLEVVYKSMDDKVLDPSKIQQGTDFVAEVRVSRGFNVTSELRDIALTQIFPSGWEISNSRLGNFTQAANAVMPFDYQDVRDDRVMTYFNLSKNGSFRIQLNAAYKGRYFLPPASCESMYDNRIGARTMGQWVEVI